MATEYRHTLNGFYGQLSATLPAASITMTNSAFQILPTITGTADYIPLSLTDETLRLIEVVWIREHATGSATVKIDRAKEGTLAREWLTGTEFGQADLVRDGLPAYTSGTIPTDLHVGARFVVTDHGAVLVKSLTSGNVAAVGIARPGDVGPTRSGAYPGTADVITVRSGNAVVTTNASGDGTITFLEEYSWACCSVNANSADPAVYTGPITIIGESTTGFDFRAASSAGVPFVGNVRISYIATGW